MGLQHILKNAILVLDYGDVLFLKKIGHFVQNGISAILGVFWQPFLLL